MNGIGETISFGKYEWLVIDKKDDMTMIISKEMVGQQPYNDFRGDVTWADCYLRRYLNEEFYNEFSATEQRRIVPVVNKNDNNQWYDSTGGVDTEDHIFLLSIEEAVCKYFGDSRHHLEHRSAKQRYWFQKKDENNIKRQSTYDGYSWWWWLRSPGRDNKRAVYIHGDGNVGIQGNGTFKYSSKTIHPITKENYGGVRPVMWLKNDD